MELFNYIKLTHEMQIITAISNSTYNVYIIEEIPTMDIKSFQFLLWI